MPVFGEDVIVFASFQNNLSWYVSANRFWYLDKFRYLDAREKAGGDTSYMFPAGMDRFGIAVVDEKSADKFLAGMQRYRVDVITLQCWLLDVYKNNFDDIYAYLPSIFVDFDARVLLNFHSEFLQFHEYVPDGWRGEYGDFEEKVPLPYRYWVIDGWNYFTGQKEPSESEYPGKD